MLLFVACGVKLYIDTQAIENGETTKDYLVDYIMHDSVNMRDRFWTGVYKFEVDGEIYTCYSDKGTTPKSSVSKEIYVEYEKTDPTINRDKAETKTIIMFMLVGVIITIIGVVVGRKL